MSSQDPDILKRMIVSAINAREIESARISRLLHDEVGQVLSAVGLQMDVLKLDYKGAIPEIVDRIHEIQKVLDSAVQQVRTLSYDLNPSIVERAGLQTALDRMVGRFRSVFPGSLRLHYDQAIRIPAEIGTVWYKIAELAVDNSVRHAGAQKIEIAVRANQRAATMEVRDDGQGFDPDAAREHSSGLGLLLMEHYAARLQAVVEIKSRPGNGTLIRCTSRLTGN